MLSDFTLILHLCLITGGFLKVVTLVLKGATGWFFRVIEKIESFPLLFMFFLRNRPDEVDNVRAQLSQRLLDTPDCCLESLYSDLAVKVKIRFGTELLYVVQNQGRVPTELYVYLLSYRSQAPLETQDIEGRASYIQTMAKRAPYLQIALASHRMSLAMGLGIGAEECTNLHGQVTELVKSDHWANKFVPSAHVGATPPPSAVVVCPHARTATHLWSVGVSLDAYRRFGTELSAKFVYQLGSSEQVFQNSFFTMHFSYYRTIFTAKCQLIQLVHELRATIIVPLQISRLRDRMVEHVARNPADFAPEPSARMTVVLVQYPVVWIGPTRCILKTAESKRFELKARMPASSIGGRGLPNLHFRD
jgi:hypothetical protein